MATQKIDAPATMVAPGNLPSAAAEAAGVADFPLANPWPWLAAGLGFALWAWLWTLTFGDISSDYRVIVLALGLLLAGVGVWLRWGDRQTPYLGRWAPGLIPGGRLAMGVLFGAIFLGVSGLFIYSFAIDSIRLRSGPLALVWITTAPASFFAARRCFRAAAPGQAQSPIEIETALAFVAAAGACLLGSLALYLPGDANEWDTIRLVLRVLTALSLFGAALTLLAPGARRLFISIVVTLHFMGIANATLAAPPSPWLVMQSWVRLFRPYLEFMYLNNAYHFYAPEPGPTSYLWFRLIYTDKDHVEHGWWYKVPQIDERGRLQHTVALEYQRFLSMTEAVAQKDNLPPPFIFVKGVAVPHPFYADRLNLLPRTEVAIGVQEDRASLRIPLHPRYPSEAAQTNWPAYYPRQLLSSFARAVAHEFATHPEDPELKFKSVRIYRVVHAIPRIEELMNGLPPTDPEFYHAFYVGNFDRNGNLIAGLYDRQGNPTKVRDPYLYWLLPTLRDNPSDPNSGIKDYARLHAGDRNWYRPPGQRTWVEHAVPGRRDE